MFEGGIHSVGVVHSPLLPESVWGTENNALIHVSDWFPTFVDYLAGEDVSDIDLDGYNIWNDIL